MTTVFAPGVHIPAAKNGGGVIYLSGTSMASPVVAGAVVIIQQVAEALLGVRLTVSELIDILKGYGDQIFDGDDEQSSIDSTDLWYPRLNIMNVAEAILKVAGPAQYTVQLVGNSNLTGLDFGAIPLSEGQNWNTGVNVGTVFNDRLVGTDNNDDLFGGMGNDVLVGRDGIDLIYGGLGDDLIIGGNGADILSGGPGNDVFKFEMLSELGDEVIDFEGGLDGDVIHIEKLLKSLGYTGTDPFNDGWCVLVQDGNDTLLKLDTNGSDSNFNTVVCILKNFDVNALVEENIFPSSSTPSSSIVSNNTSISSLDSGDDLGIEIPTGIDITSDTDVLDDGNSFLNSFLWVHEFDINSITLPETVMDEISGEAFDLTDLYGLLGFQTDSLALNFETFAEDTSIAIEAVKPMDLSPSNPVLDHYQDSWLEDLVYSSELG